MEDDRASGGSPAGTTNRIARTSDSQAFPDIAPAYSGLGSVIGLSLNMPWLLRIQTRNKELCSFFGIDPEQTLLDDFGCAFQGNHSPIIDSIAPLIPLRLDVRSVFAFSRCTTEANTSTRQSLRLRRLCTPTAAPCQT